MIKPATETDIPAMIELFLTQHAAMGCAWDVDTDVLAGTLYQAVQSPGAWLCLTGDHCLLLAACFESQVGAGKVATELCMCASAGRLDELIDRYEEWARAKGCRAASLSCDRRFATFERLYRRYGYSPSEMTMSKVL